MLKSRIRKTVVVTMGDPAGVGPEVTASALKQGRLAPGTAVVVIGNRGIWKKVWKDRDNNPLFVHVTGDDRPRHVPGIPTAASGRDSLLYLEKAVEIIKAGKAQALVTAPVSKEAISQYIPGFKGHTTYLANAFNLKNVEMLFVGSRVRLVLVTRHVSIKEVPGLITARKVEEVIRTSRDFLVERFGIERPRIAVLGLNPHAGEGGHIGREEIQAIVPAMAKLRACGIDVHGPFPADTFFDPHHFKGCDLVVAMYHDQGLAPLKCLYFDSLVNLTAGLPFIRTSPVHGTAFGIAGQGKANAGSMKAALELATRL